MFKLILYDLMYDETYIFHFRTTFFIYQTRKFRTQIKNNEKRRGKISRISYPTGTNQRFLMWGRGGGVGVKALSLVSKLERF